MINNSYPIIFNDSVYSYVLWRSEIRQGWKIHISLLLENYEEVLEKVSRYLNGEKVSYKYIYDLNQVKFFLSGDAPYGQLGKIITIYPDTENIFLQLLQTLSKILSGYKGPDIISDEQFEDTIIFYRYGVFEDGGVPYLINDKSIYSDERDYYLLPEFVSPIIVNNKEERLDRIGVDICPISIIHVSSSGNVYEVIKDSEEFILKEGRKYVLVQDSTAIEEIVNEEKLLKFLNANNVKSPKFYESFFENGNYYILCEKIKGVTLDYYSSTINLSDYKEIFINLVKLVQEHHKRKVILHDISPKNIIIDEHKESYFVDYGFSYYLFDESSYQNLDSFTTSYSDKTVENFSPIEQDYHKLGYLFLNCIFPIVYYNEYDKTGETTLKIFKEYCYSEGIEEFYDIIFKMIRSPKNFEENFLELLNKVRIKETERKLRLPNFNTLNIRKRISEYKNFLELTEMRDYKVDNLLFPEFDFLFSKAYCLNVINKLVDNTEILDYKKMSNQISFTRLGLFLVLILEYHQDLFIPIEILEKLSNSIARENLENNGLFTGKLGKSYFFFCMFKLLGNEEHLSLALDEFHKLNLLVKCEGDELLFFDNEEYNISSPYISNGLAGYLLVFYKLYKLGNTNLDNKKRAIIDSALRTLSNSTWYKNSGFFEGGAGISLILYLYSKLFDNDFYKEKSIEILDYALRMDVINQGSASPISPETGKEDLGMNYGLFGKLFVLEKLIELSGGN